MTAKLQAAVIGSGNIGTDLMFKLLRHGKHTRMAAMVGIDPDSDGLARARRLGIATTHAGVEGLVELPEFADIGVVFDATSASAHVRNDAFLRRHKPGSIGNSNALFKPDRPWVNPTPPLDLVLAHPSTA
jgi:acetaldehyde dehydrogenase